MKIAIVLNFNNYKATSKCIKNLIQSEIDKVIVVDNNSSNKSFSYLNANFKDENRIDIIGSGKNGGYSFGNNVGLKYAEKYGLGNTIFIVNPDTFVSAQVIDEVNNFICENPNAGMVTVKVNKNYSSVWMHTGKKRAFFLNFLILGYLFSKFGVNEQRAYKNIRNKYQKVDVVSGAFFGINQKLFKKIGYFDEGTFLYYEEEILFCKLKKARKQNYILSDLTYYHQGKSSTNIEPIKTKRIMDTSRLYYLVKYNNLNKLLANVYKISNKIDDGILNIYLHIQKHKK